jgi:hypothetical protein
MPSSRSSSPSRHSQTDTHSAHEVSSLKRRLAALQRQVDEGASTHVKKPMHVSMVIPNSYRLTTATAQSPLWDEAFGASSPYLNQLTT